VGLFGVFPNGLVGEWVAVLRWSLWYRRLTEWVEFGALRRGCGGVLCGGGGGRGT